MNVHKMSITEKVGQLFMVGFEGARPTGEVINLISTYKVGGLCYVTENYRNPRQIHRLSKKLQAYAHKELPLFLSVYQEGGEYNCFSKGVIQGPDQSTLGIVNNRLYTKQMAEMVAEELSALGINMNISPSLTINNDHKNSFGDSIDLVANHGVAAIQGYQKKNVTAVAKYFPGPIDSSVERLLMKSYDMPHSTLYPFFKVIQKDVDAILVSDSMIPNTNIENPALFTHSIIQGFVRNKLNYNGLLIKEIHEKETVDEIAAAAITAIQSGVDLICLTKPYKIQIAVIDAVMDAIKEGLIPVQRLNESVERILSLKEKRKVGRMEPFNQDIFEKKRAVRFIHKLEEMAVSRT